MTTYGAARRGVGPPKGGATPSPGRLAETDGLVAIGAPTATPAGARRMDVADLVTWVYRDQKAHLGAAGGTAVYEAALTGGSASMTAVVGRIGALGCQVDRGGAGNARLHPVAEAVDRRVEAMPDGRLLRRYGISGRLPEGYDLRERLRPVWLIAPEYDAAWRPKPGSFVVCYRHDARQRREPVYCPVAWDRDSRFVEERRAECMAWFAALRDLGGWCRASAALLRGWTITGPSLRPPNWLDSW